MGFFQLFHKSESFFLMNALQTGFFILLMTFVQFVAVRTIRNAETKWNLEQKNRWISRVRAFFVITTVLGVVYIWADIGPALLSVSAIVLASVMATKELLMCVDGAFIRFRSDMFDVGDRIEVHNIRGDVLEIGILTTKVLEVVPEGGQEHSGRIVSIPNSWFVAHAVHNESLLEGFHLYSIVIPLSRSAEIKGAKALIEQIAQEECRSFSAEANAVARKVARERSLVLPSVEPRTTVCLLDHERVDILVHVTTPSRLKAKIEQAIIERFLSEYRSS